MELAQEDATELLQDTYFSIIVSCLYMYEYLQVCYVYMCMYVCLFVFVCVIAFRGQK